MVEETKKPEATSEVGGQVDPLVVRGVDAYLMVDDGRRDLFVADEQAFHFPCGECIHRHGGNDYCKQCKHYVL